MRILSLFLAAVVSLSAAPSRYHWTADRMFREVMGGLFPQIPFPGPGRAPWSGGGGATCTGAGGYAKCAENTINSSQITGTISNYTQRIVGTFPEFATVANGGQVQHTTTDSGITVPADLIFTTDTGASSLTNWKFAAYDSTTGFIDALVLRTSAAVGSTIYAFVGNNSVSSFQGNTGCAFSSNVKFYGPFADGTTFRSTNFACSGIGGSGSASNISATSGQLGGGGSFNGTNSSYDLGDASTHFSNLTACAWVNPTSGGGQLQIWNKGYDAGSNHAEFQLGFTVGGNNIEFGTYNGTFHGATSSGTAANSTWTHVCGTYDGSTFKVYINGALDASNADAVGFQTNEFSFYEIGASYCNGCGGLGLFFPGKIDEPVLANADMTAAWIGALYKNGLSSSGFATMSAFN